MQHPVWIVPLLPLLALAVHAPAADFAARFEEIKKSATPAQLFALLYDLPKGGDLHNHAGGANLPEWTLAVLTDPARNGGDAFFTRVRLSDCGGAHGAPALRYHTLRRRSYERLDPCLRADYVPIESLDAAQRAEWISAMQIDRPGEGRDEFFVVSIWTRLGDTGSNPHVRIELLVDNLKAFGAEKVRYLETQFGVRGFYTNDGEPIDIEEGVAMLRRRLEQPDVRATGVAVRFQETVLRFSPAAEAQLEHLYTFVDAHRDLWVGLNMAGIEEKGPGYPRRFLQKFREMRRTHATLPLSIHAGEMDGPDSHVRDTLLLGASRIGHGVNLIHDEETLLLLQQSRRVLVEINLISNRLLEYVPDLAQHPFPEYLRTGVPVCLNTDDRGMWHSNMTDEYFTAVTTFNLSWDELVALGHNSLAYSFAEPELKARLLAAYERDVHAFEEAYAAGSVGDALRRLGQVRPITYSYGARTWGFPFAAGKSPEPGAR